MGGKGASYSGPSAFEISQQNEALKQQWDMTANQEKINAELLAKQDTATAATTELQGRQGVGQALANSQVGFTKKPTDEDDGGLLT